MSFARRFASQALPRRADAIIIGSGVIGSSIAYELSKKGLQTVNVDSGSRVSHTSSLQSSGIMQYCCSNIEMAKLAHEGFLIWRNWADYLEHHSNDGELATFHPMGSVLLKRGAGGKRFSSVAEKNMRDLGVTYHDWTIDAVNENLPFIDFSSSGSFYDTPVTVAGYNQSNISGALYLPETGFIDNESLAAINLQDAAARRGATFAFDSKVAEIMQMGGRCCGVRVAGAGMVWAPIVVNAAGPSSSSVQHLAFHGGYGQYSDSKVEAIGVRTTLYRRAISMDSGDAAIPLIADLERNVFLRHGMQQVVCGNLQSELPSNIQSLQSDDRGLGSTEEHSLDQQGKMSSAWIEYSAWYDITSDGIPIYDKTSFPGFYTAVGAAGNQFQTCAVVGQLMAELIEACQNGYDHDKNAIKVQLPISGLPPVNVQKLSRLREAT